MTADLMLAYTRTTGGILVPPDCFEVVPFFKYMAVTTDNQRLPLYWLSKALNAG